MMNYSMVTTRQDSIASAITLDRHVMIPIGHSFCPKSKEEGTHTHTKHSRTVDYNKD